MIPGTKAVAFWRYPLAFAAAFVGYYLTQPLFGPLFAWGMGHGWLVAIFLWTVVMLAAFALIALQSSVPLFIAPNLLGACLVFVGSVTGRCVRLSLLLSPGSGFDESQFTRLTITELLSAGFMCYTVGHFVYSTLKARRSVAGK